VCCRSLAAGERLTGTSGVGSPRGSSPSSEERGEGSHGLLREGSGSEDPMGEELSRLWVDYAGSMEEALQLGEFQQLTAQLGGI